MQRKYLFLLVIIGALLGTLEVAIAAPTAVPIVGGTTFGTAVAVSPGVEYTGTVSTTHDLDFFYFDVTPGQIATVVFTSTATWGGSAYFALWDQLHVSQLRSRTISGAEQAYQWVYMGNNTTPTRYYLKVDNSSYRNQYLFQVAVADQSDGNVAGDAGDSLATARVITPTAGGITSYSGNRLANADTQDWFRINAASGQIISLTVTILDCGGAGSMTLALDDQAAVLLDQETVTKPNMTSAVLSWASNNSLPSAYLLKVLVNNNTDNLLVYKFDVQMSQQNDGGTPGDAGDNFDSARTITLSTLSPSLTASGNMLAATDKDDYFLIKLPPTAPMGTPVRYWFELVPNTWPSGPSSYIRLYAYDWQRNLLSSLGKIIYAPSTTIFTAEVTSCGSDGCYFRIYSNYSGNNPVGYTIKAVPIRYLYLPLVIK